MNNGFHPVEYFGLFIRRLIFSLYSKISRKDINSFHTFMAERMPFFDLLVGSVILIGLTILLVYAYVLLQLLGSAG